MSFFDLNLIYPNRYYGDPMPLEIKRKIDEAIGGADITYSAYLEYIEVLAHSDYKPALLKLCDDYEHGCDISNKVKTKAVDIQFGFCRFVFHVWDMK